MAQLDIAVVNLACAAGLPGAETIDVSGCLRWLDRAADMTRRWTDAGLDEFFRPNPGEYKDSEAYFRVLALTMVLQRHCGVRYDPSKAGAGPEVPFEFHERFIHGAIQGPGGTCSTLPVVYAAVGRRLGYPIRLACTRRHLFARWDDPTGERFNIECAGVGFYDPPDDHYLTWPQTIGGVEERQDLGYLESYNHRREVADAVARRGFVLQDGRRYREAVECFAAAAELTPGQVTYPLCVDEAVAEWEGHLRGRYPPGFPRRIEAFVRQDRRRWVRMPWEVERHIAAVHTAEWCLDNPDYERWWWGPLRRGERPQRDVPTGIGVDYDLRVCAH
ncbi:MAG: hypothetical protein K2X82_29645 [Gemmataceae bacterium]|nr:hypothetical protein [Gemmataceae bacterium]